MATKPETAPKLPFSGGFYMLPKAVFDWPKITNNSRVLFAYLYDLSTNPRNEAGGSAYPGTRDIAKELRMSKSTVDTAIQFLKAQGLISVAPLGGKIGKRLRKGKAVNAYRIKWDRVNGVGNASVNSTSAESFSLY